MTRPIYLQFLSDVRPMHTIQYGTETHQMLADKLQYFSDLPPLSFLLSLPPFPGVLLLFFNTRACIFVVVADIRYIVQSCGESYTCSFVLLCCPFVNSVFFPSFFVVHL